MIAAPGELIVELPVGIIVDRIVLASDAVVISAGGVGVISSGHGGCRVRVPLRWGHLTTRIGGGKRNEEARSENVGAG